MLLIWAALGVVLAAGTGIWLASTNDTLRQLASGPQKWQAALEAQSETREDATVATTEATYEGGTSGTDGAEGTQAQPTPEDSYSALLSTYRDIEALGNRIGNKSSQSGFAYDVFNKYIGSSKRSRRQRIVSKGNDLLREIAGDRERLQELNVTPEYESCKSDLLELYDLLAKRVRVMRDAAKIAVRSPRRDAWYPKLQPASTNAREAFERAYPDSAPSSP